MPPYYYRHQVIRWNPTSNQPVRYCLQTVALSPTGEPLQQAQWDFTSLRGLLNFLSKHFPDVDATTLQFHRA
jgi:hypothetical protein